MASKKISREAPEGFDQSWLACRAPYDQEARSEHLATLAYETVTQAEYQIVMDLGCGSGNNVAFLSVRWPGVQTWLGVDHDPALVAAATLRFADGKPEFEGLVADLLDLGELLGERQPAVLIANAVFDLFTQDMMAEILEVLSISRTPLLSTLLYTGMVWEDALPDDGWVIGQYEAHMMRQRPSGRGLGPKAPEVIAQLVEALGGTLRSEPSLWRVPASDQHLQGHLLRFMEGSVPEMLSDAASQQRFLSWLTARRATPSVCTVHHLDQWITW